MQGITHFYDSTTKRFGCQISRYVVAGDVSKERVVPPARAKVEQQLRELGLEDNFVALSGYYEKDPVVLLPASRATWLAVFFRVGTDSYAKWRFLNWLCSNSQLGPA